MKRTFVTWIVLLGIFVSVSSQTVVVGDSAELSMITCSPGPLSYEKFGHTALRYFDPATGVDLVFNYGIFDFDQPNFYTKFIKGETYYMLGVHEPFYFLESYRRRNSYVIEQVLNLSPEERKAALILSKTVALGKELAKTEKDANKVVEAMKKNIETEPLAKIDYVEAVDALSMAPVEKLEGTCMLAMAVYIGKTRLIDNTLINE